MKLRDEIKKFKFLMLERIQKETMPYVKGTIHIKLTEIAKRHSKN